MKGLRKLRSIEGPRVGDWWQTSAGYWVTLEPLAQIHPDVTYYRKARTTGCPPGWRFADKGEWACTRLRDFPKRVMDGVTVGVNNTNWIVPYEEEENG